jgi:predicted phage terminase large subunit-like protein
LNSIDHRLHAALNEALRNDFRSFARKVFGVVSPDQPFKPNWHFDAIAHALEKCVAGHTKRLLITLPPRSGKSILCSVALPAFILGRDPTQRLICASYANELAAKFGRDTRAIMQTRWYQGAFPETRLSSEKQTETELMTTARGVRLSTSVGGVLTGRGGNFIIVDDAMKPEDAVSDAKRAQATNWFDGTLMSRLDDKEKGVVIVVMQRLQVEDLAGHVLAKGGYEHLNLPAIAETESSIATGWGKSHTRRVGEPLHQGLTPEVLERTKTELGSFLFSAQYQQQPVPLDGEMIKWGWFRNYDEAPAKQEYDRIIQSWDTAATPGASSDYSACTTWLTRKNHYYLLDVTRVKLDFPSLRSRIIAHYRDWGANSLLIERAGSGIGLIQELRRTSGAPQPISIGVHKDKRSRVAAVSSMIEQGQVFLPTKASWLDDFRSELLQFPNGRHDDQIDSMSQFLNWKREQKLHYSGPSEGSVLVTADPYEYRRDPDIVDVEADDHGGFIDPADYARTIF